MKQFRHTRILDIPNGDRIPGGWLEDLRNEETRSGVDLVMDFRGLHLADTPQIFEKQGRLYERVCGDYLPYRLRFHRVTRLVQAGLYRNLESIPLTHGARSLHGLFYWRTTQGVVECILVNGSDQPAELRFSAERCTGEARIPANPIPVDLVRDWSTSPQLPAGLVPDPIHLHRRFGGDPVSLSLEGKKYQRRLFVGGIEIQPRARPQVDAVLNLGEEPSLWAGRSLPATDRWVKKGEGQFGMTIAEVKTEAEWVIERLRAGQRVLVHCWAGMNRSATIACAVLILLEGISAEAALKRVRAHHPWARPDSQHWLILRWLANHD